MQYRLLGRTGLRVSEIGLGTWAMGGPTEIDGKPIGWGPADDAQSLRALARARELGVNCFDTADVYGFGHAEELLGRAFDGRWEGCYVATKVGNVRAPGARTEKNFSREYIQRACEESLRRLRKETVDLYQLHNPSLDILCAGDWPETMEKLRAAGKIRFYGVSITTIEETKAFLDRGQGDTIQLVYNLLRQEMTEIFPLVQRKNIGVIARVPLYYGLLTGKISPGTRFPPDDHRSARFPAEVLAAELHKVEKLKFLVQTNRTLAQAALKFILSHPAVSCTIPGGRSERQVEENCAASDSNLLSREELDHIQALWRAGFGS